ncbi:MAG TPA: prepilin-type N-terminal cleavage/methylation domain-containing protein, partial [Polyangia bacterium]
MRSATPPRPSPNRNIASGDTGFTLVELLVVVVIIAILAALGIPRLTRDRLGREGRDFATLLTGELQRARIQAVATRL